MAPNQAAGRLASGDPDMTGWPAGQLPAKAPRARESRHIRTRPLVLLAITSLLSSALPGPRKVEPSVSGPANRLGESLDALLIVVRLVMGQSLRALDREVCTGRSPGASINVAQVKGGRVAAPGQILFELLTVWPGGSGVMRGMARMGWRP
jgi:hypothetical protein